MMLICIKQHLSNIWSSIHEKGKQRWGKSVDYKKSMYSTYSTFILLYGNRRFNIKTN